MDERMDLTSFATPASAAHHKPVMTRLDTQVAIPAIICSLMSEISPALRLHCMPMSALCSLFKCRSHTELASVAWEWRDGLPGHLSQLNLDDDISLTLLTGFTEDGNRAEVVHGLPAALAVPVSCLK